MDVTLQQVNSRAGREARDLDRTPGVAPQSMPGLLHGFVTRSRCPNGAKLPGSPFESGDAGLSPRRASGAGLQIREDRRGAFQYFAPSVVDAPAQWKMVRPTLKKRVTNNAGAFFKRGDSVDPLPLRRLERRTVATARGSVGPNLVTGGPA